jgi:hypothetical protein
MVTIELLSCNDIPILAQLFEESFDYYIKKNPLFVADYIRDLRTLVGLGFAAVLADNGMVCVYQTYLKSFMAADRGCRHAPGNSVPSCKEPLLTAH